MSMKLKNILSALLSLALMIGLLPGMSLTVKADDVTSESAAEILKPTVNNEGVVTEAKILFFARKPWYVIASGEIGVPFDTDTVSKENGQTTIVLLAVESEDWDNVKFSENGSLDYSTSVLKATIDGYDIENSLTNNDSWMKDLIAKRSLTGGASSGEEWQTIDKICGDTVTEAILWPLSANEASKIDESILKYGDNNRDWWLRSRGPDSDGLACVWNGNVSTFRYDNKLYVRPALCLNLTDDISASSLTVYGYGQGYRLTTNYPLKVGGTQVTSENAGNIDGSNKASYDANTNTLTLNGYSYSGDGCCINYTGNADLNLELTGKNTITYTNTQNGIYVPNASLCVSGTGSLILNSQGIGIYNGKNITIQNVTLNIESQANGINCPGNAVTIENSSVTSKGLSGISAADIEISESTVECSGTSYGIVGTSTITIGSDITSLTVSGNTGAAYGTVKNSVAGMGWNAVDGTGEGTEIDVNTSGASLENYKKLLFPYKKPAAIVKTAPTAKSDLIFNGSAQELITPGDKGEGAKEIQYAIDTDSSTAPKEDWSTSIPTATDSGTYYVWYKAIGDESHSDSDANYVTVKIEEKTEAHTHKIVHVEAKEPTCTEDGYEAHYECTECDKWFKDLGGHYLMTETEKTEITKKATGHKWDRGVVTEEATYDETGIKTYTCSVCGETKDETIPVKTGSSSSDSDSDSDSSSGGSSGKSGSISTKSIDVNGNTVQTQPDSGAPLSDRGGNWENQEYIWTYTKSDGSLAKGEWLNLEYDGHTYWYYFDDSTIMQTNWFDYNGSRYFLVPEMDGWRGRMATGWHMVDNKWYYFEPTIGANQGILLRGMTTPDGHTVGADGAWDGNGTTPVGAIHTGTTVTMN